jgi:hypothetical protein
MERIVNQHNNLSHEALNEQTGIDVVFNEMAIEGELQ